MEQEDVARAMDDMGFRCVQTGGVNDFSKDVRWIDYMYNKYNQAGSLQSYQLGFHAEYTTNIDNLKTIASVVQKNRAPLYVHACETREEVAGCVQRYGKTPVAFLDSLGLEPSHRAVSHQQIHCLIHINCQKQNAKIQKKCTTKKKYYLCTRFRKK